MSQTIAASVGQWFSIASTKAIPRLDFSPTRKRSRTVLLTDETSTQDSSAEVPATNALATPFMLLFKTTAVGSTLRIVFVGSMSTSTIVFGHAIAQFLVFIPSSWLPKTTSASACANTASISGS